MDRIDIEENAGETLAEETGLWIAVTLDAFFTLRDGGAYQGNARGWIEDRENLFFNSMADRLGYDPDKLRERIREALNRSRKEPRKPGQGEEITPRDRGIYVP